ncbi:S-adenosyl-L-methionine-dependent methyltransferase [Cladochytrium replicatum]|nr:S-adenosyl-L-methionine-dependent methyltransferase [Cladochytrium replicatum]
MDWTSFMAGFLACGIAVVIAFLALAGIFSSRTKNTTKSYTYGLRQALLNTTNEKTWWFNMGYWKSATSYVNAAEDMARLVAQCADLRAGDRVMDFGFGCGDQDALFLREFSVREIIGITAENSQARVALLNPGLSKMELHRKPKSDASVFHALVGDAVESSTWRRIDPDSDALTDASRMFEDNFGKVDAVVGVDCIYHFDSRSKFLENAWLLLKDGGRLGLTDIILGPRLTSLQMAPLQWKSWILSWALIVFCYASGVPLKNMVNLHEYKEKICGCGFGDVEVTDISADVFPGLSNFIRRHEEALKRTFGPLIFVPFILWRITGALLCWFHEKQLLRFVAVKAKKT